METTAEGVETLEQLELVRTAGCQLAQGYLFGRPVPLHELKLDAPNPKLSSSVAA
jgi:EAL domain-containing protein (putative c-di-GMP-specific phosphodiesterase class I)